MRAGRLRGLVPGPLLGLLVAVATVGSAWALVVPAWEAPDEPLHFGYVQTLVERHARPDEKPGLVYSREQQLALDRTYGRLVMANPRAKPEWRPAAYDAWRAADSRLGSDARSDGGHAARAGAEPNAARVNPPLYYAFEAVPYSLASRGDLFDRLYLMRLWSLALLLVATAATWLFIGEVCGREPLLQLAGAALVGLQPMASFVSSSINPDAMLIATWALAFWLGARVLKRGLTWATGLGLLAVLAVALLTKATSLALVPAVAFALGVAAWPHRPSWLSPRALWAGVAVGAVALSIPVGAAVLARLPKVEGGGVSDFLSYLWQFYLPRLPWQEDFPLIDDLAVYDRWIEGGWGAFGWLEVRLPGLLYPLLAALSVGLLAAGVVALRRHRRPPNLHVAAFLAITALTLLAGLHWTEYTLIRGSEEGFNQGRYLLPLLPLFGLCAAAALHLLGRRRAPLVGGALLGGLLALQIVSLAVVTTRFYA